MTFTAHTMFNLKGAFGRITPIDLQMNAFIDAPAPLHSSAQMNRLLAKVSRLAMRDTLLWHWQHQAERKLYLFGIGTDFRKLKYPFVWYDILHVVDVLSRFPFIYADPRFRAMVETITAQADQAGRYTAGSMYQAWKDWSFADKKRPSPWLTFLVLRILKRLPGGQV